MFVAGDLPHDLSKLTTLLQQSVPRRGAREDHDGAIAQASFHDITIFRFVLSGLHLVDIVAAEHNHRHLWIERLNPTVHVRLRPADRHPPFTPEVWPLP